MQNYGQDKFVPMNFWTKLMSPKWARVLQNLLNDKSTNDLISTIGSYYKTKDLCPNQKDVFRAFKEVDYSNLKVVIIGQDPYHDGKSACGLAFANSMDKQGVSPSLKRILNETPNKGYFTDKDLSSWTSQGVLLLNTALTVEKGKPGSHVDLWKNFTKNTITSISNSTSGLIFMLWGAHAQSYKSCIDENLHYILEAEHPVAGAYQGRSWQSNDCFDKANDILLKNNGVDFIINW